MFCLVRRGGGKVGVPRGEGRVGGSREAGDWVGEGGMVRLFVCKKRINKRINLIPAGRAEISPSSCSASAQAAPL